MFQQVLKLDKIDLEKKVKSVYKNVASSPDAGYHFRLGRELALELGYPEKYLDAIPHPAVHSFAGVGFHFDMADIKEGESVLDLGSGSGMDLFIAKNLSKTGFVAGIDMTEAQLEKSQNLAEDHNIEVEIIKAYMENLPFEDNSFDVVISNGVLNLASEKDAVIKEIFRVLKPGGRFAFSDIISEKQMPEAITCNATLWASCIGGATQIDSLFQFMENTGFTSVLQKNNEQYTFLSGSAIGASSTYGVRSNSFLFIKHEI